VARARTIQFERWKSLPRIQAPPRERAPIPARHLDRFCPLDAKPRPLLERALEHLGLTMCAWRRLLRVSRTIAGLAGADRMAAEHVAEALGCHIATDTNA
jgi:magnesium chelatase family protein